MKRIFEEYLLSIEKLHCKDIEEILEIENDSYINPWNYNHFFYEVYNQHTCSFTLKNHEGKILGYIITHHIIDQIFLLNLTVEKEKRGLGLGKKLLFFLIEYSKKNNIRRIDLEVRKSNDTAIAVYKKASFIICGEQKKFYSDGEDAFLFYRDI